MLRHIVLTPKLNTAKTIKLRKFDFKNKVQTIDDLAEVLLHKFFWMCLLKFIVISSVVFRIIIKRQNFKYLTLKWRPKTTAVWLKINAPTSRVNLQTRCENDITKSQARSQDFGGEGARIWVPAPKGIRGVTPGKFLKNVHTIWCNILYLLHKNH